MILLLEPVALRDDPSVHFRHVAALFLLLVLVGHLRRLVLVILLAEHLVELDVALWRRRVDASPAIFVVLLSVNPGDAVLRGMWVRLQKGTGVLGGEGRVEFGERGHGGLERGQVRVQRRELLGRVGETAHLHWQRLELMVLLLLRRMHAVGDLLLVLLIALASVLDQNSVVVHSILRVLHIYVHANPLRRISFPRHPLQQILGIATLGSRHEAEGTIVQLRDLLVVVQDFPLRKAVVFEF